MMLKTAVKRLREHTALNAHQFADKLGVTHPSVLNWEKGKGGIGEYSRIRLLSFAKAYDDPERGPVPAEIVEALESAQPELQP